MSGRRVVALVLVVLAMGWVLVNGPVEGTVLIVFTPDHGLTVADLASGLAVLVAVALLWSDRRR